MHAVIFIRITTEIKYNYMKMCDFVYFIGKTITQAERARVHAVWSTLAIVGPFFKFTIVKLNETIIND